MVTGEQDSYRVPNASTATKTDALVRDIPASIQVIPRQVLEDQRITRVREAVTNVSGVTSVGGSQSVAGDRFIFRGFAESYLSGGNTFVDGFRRFDYQGFNLEVANIEQLEILKGPTSVLYGQGEPGGILNIVTKQPLATPFYAVEATIGSFDFYRPTLDFSGPLNPDKTIRYRLNAAYQNSGSFVDFAEREQVFVAPVISFDLGKNTTLTLEGEYFNTSQVEYFGLPAADSVLSGRVPRSRFLYDPDARLEREIFGFGYRLQHKFSDNLSVRSGFRALLQNYEQPSFYLELQPDNRTLTRVETRFDRSDRQVYSLQTDVIGKIQTGSIKQDLLLGVELSWLNDTRDIFFSTIPVPSIDLFNPNYDQPIPRFDEQAANERGVQNQVGVYAQDLISISDNLKILLGGRFDFVKDTYGDEIGGVSRQEREDTAFSPRVGIVYQPIQPVSLYASWSRSFLPNGAAFRNADASFFEPTKGEAFEAGVKTEFLDGKLVATLAAYQITKQNIVVSDPDRPRFSIQVGEQRSRGIEFDIAGEILPGWKIIGSYAYIDAEITEDTRPAFKGNTPTNVPRHSASLWTTYEFQTGGLKGFGFGGGVSFIGDRQGDLENTFEVPSYVRTDAAIYYRRGQLGAALNFKNIFDVYYFESADFGFVSPGAPFTVLGTVSVQF
ncbi:TonB-dependent siderophore receptor [Tolypothrix sp. VBCCA 56010]|uniref:TonB-dependent siderophore receptor n=1 Tax=Tolypothrix sp. VBCCA 56010 TaxID=3137731 RepID=UPI003D7F0EDD